MKLIKVGAAALNQTPMAWDANKANILAAIDAARAEQVSILCLPEMCISGYGCEDAFHSRGTRETAWKILQEVLPATRGMIVSLGLPVLYNNALFNTVCLAADGRILGFPAKRFLAGDGIHYEPRWFKPWPHDSHALLHAGGVDYPLGDVYFDCGDIRIGFEICEDAWVAERPGGTLSLRGVDVILNPSASHFAFGKHEVRKRFVLEGARAFGVTYIYSNLLGNEAGRVIYDGGAIIASGGKMVALGPRFSFADFVLTTGVIDVDLTRMGQARTGSFQPKLDVHPAECVQTSFAFPELEPARSTATPASWETGARLKEEEFARAVALGLFDYMRKSRSEGFVVSISGGADSAAVSCLVAVMVELGLAELGPERFLGKLGHVRELAGKSDGPAAAAREVVRALLTCAYQSTANSSDVTRSAARGVAEAIGARFLELDVDSLVQQYVALAAGGLGRELNWETDDVALQNIQARVRGPSVWLLANVKRALLLSTSNRSEAAVGYATMDGDTCGGLSPIAGIDKAYLRRWLVWMEREGPDGLHPIAALAAVTAQAPTAELRPSGSHQTDEADLMPYELLDAVERAAIRDKQTPVEVFRRMKVEFPQYARGELAVWVERFFRLFCRNQWKRERYAPSFHLDDENLDPKTWCRFPILSGNFDRELAELKAYVAQK
ncbi:MAG: NAD(+) synthase [Candidatus Wallbacteria bacterium]|nr:NAD(+) synthase [Candidatus Wallbacteria bacterium]